MDKRRFFIAIAILCAVTGAHSLDFGVGLNLGYALTLENDRYPGLYNYDSTFHQMTAGVYFDADYLRLAVDFVTNPGPPITNLVSMNNLKISYLMFTALLKLPLSFGTSKLWSGAGARFQLCLFADVNGDGVNDLTAAYALDDFYLTLAVGGEFRLIGLFTFGPMFSINYDLTPNFTVDEPAGIAHTRVFFEVSFALGYAF